MPMHLEAIWATWSLTGHIFSTQALSISFANHPESFVLGGVVAILALLPCNGVLLATCLNCRSQGSRRNMQTSKHGWLRVHRHTPSSPGKLTTGLLLLNVCHHLIIALATELAGLLQEWIGCRATVRMCPESWPCQKDLLFDHSSLPFFLRGGSLIIYHWSWHFMIIIPLRCSSGKAKSMCLHSKSCIRETMCREA